MRQLILIIGLIFVPDLVSANLYQKLIDNSVVVHFYMIENGRKFAGTCTGTYISSNTVLTAAHCVTDVIPGKIWIKEYNGESKPVKIGLYTTSHDLALLHVYGPPHSYIKLGRKPKIGDRIESIGCPFGLNFLVSEGIIAATDRLFLPFFSKYLIHTAMINPGSSGGGVFDRHGRLVGVNTMSPGIFGWIGISDAVQIDTVRIFLYAE